MLKARMLCPDLLRSYEEVWLTKFAWRPDQLA